MSWSCKAWVSHSGSHPLCFSRELPPHRSGNLVVTCTSLSVLPQAMLSPLHPQLHSHLFFCPSAFALFCLSRVLPRCFSPLCVWLPAVWEFIYSCRIFPSFLLLRVRPLSWCEMTTSVKKELTLSLFTVSQTGINTKASELWDESVVMAGCQSSSCSAPNINLAVFITEKADLLFIS